MNHRAMTNADKIRRMSDEELADFIKDIKKVTWNCALLNMYDKMKFIGCYAWLKQEAKNEKFGVQGKVRNSSKNAGNVSR